MSQLPLQIEATRQLHGIARSQGVPQEQAPRFRGNFRSQFDNRKSRHVALESG
ncbi:MAG: hypothetical protein HYX76_11225 [Acidobacteria bacterium]|nr:hypothetical protein [Acidobacteriota bacterium]